MSDPADPSPPVPETVRTRFGIDGPGAAVLAVLALLGVLLGGWVLWRSRPVAVDLGRAAGAEQVAVAQVPAAQVSADSAVATPPVPPDLVIDVQGRVRHPGVVRLPVGSRVLDALAAAGGARVGASTAGVNLARPLVDGEQVVLADPSSPGEVGPATSGPGPAPGGPPARIDLNTATLVDLDGLPGVGPVLAQRILDFRAEHGRFTAVEELQEVPGIGPAKYASLRPKVRV